MKINNIIILFILGLASSCIEPFEFQTEIFEDALVIQASLTSESKRHQVMLTRAVRFEDSIFSPERSAQVRILDDLQNVYEFQENEPGTYTSAIEFAAQKGVKYKLMVTTSDGTDYSSDEESFESESEIEAIYADRVLNDEGEDGIVIRADSFDSSGASQYYRYEYEETYKIVAPNWTPVDFQLTNYEPCNPDPDDPSVMYDLDIVRRTEEQQTCYNTVSSSDIIQTSSAGLSKARIERFPVRFIPGTDFILTHRYSILVKQYVQSANAFSYFQSLDDFSSSTDVFTEIQPGFLAGNINSENDSDKKVLGYFEVASVSEKRIFFEFRDFYPEAPFPLYVNKCILNSAPTAHVSYCFTGPNGTNCPESLIERLARDNGVTFASMNDGTVGASCPGEYVVVERECGDCTVLGSNIVPDFWVE